MRTFLRGKVTLLFMVLGMLLAVPAMALADQIGNNIDADAIVDATVEQTSVQLGGPAGSDTKTVGYFISPEGPAVDGDAGCNLDGTETMVANVASSDTSVATVSSTPANTSQVTFSGPGCGSTPQVKVTGVSPGTATITLTQFSNNSGGTFGFTNATFQVNVDRATSITNVSGEGTEGSTATLTAQLNSLYSGTSDVSGKDIAFKLGGTDVGTATTNASGVAQKTVTLPNTYLSANSPYAGEVSASFARVAGYAASGPVTGSLTVNPSCTNPAAPVFQNTANANGWFTSTPTPNATTTTSGATVKYSSTETGTYDATPPTLGEGQATVWAKAFSSTGTCSSAAVSMVFKVDTIAPSVNPASVTDGTWRNTSLSQAFTASDNGSGLANTADASFTLTASDESADANTPTVVSKMVSDVAGNSTTRSVSAKIDLSNPSVSASLNKTAVNGWFNLATGAPTVSFQCSDALSGLATTCPSSYTFPEGANQSRSSGTILDNAGNSNSAGVTGINVDLTKPNNINFTGGGLTDGATYDFGSVPAAPTGCTADDSGSSALKDCVLDSGYSTAVGSHTIKATATDNAGNVETKPLSYTVRSWTMTGFYSPVDMGTTLNTVKGGSTVPFKFELFQGPSTNLTELTDTAKVQTLRQVKVACDTSAVLDDIELTATGGTSLRYDTTNGGQFIYNWQTPKQAGACYDVTITAQDGSFKTAHFKLK